MGSFCLDFADDYSSSIIWLSGEKSYVKVLARVHEQTFWCHVGTPPGEPVLEKWVALSPLALCDGDITVLPTCLALMVWGPGTETLAGNGAEGPSKKRVHLCSMLLLALRSPPCLGGTAVLPLSWAWHIWPLSVVMLSRDTEAHQL